MKAKRIIFVGYDSLDIIKQVYALHARNYNSTMTNDPNETAVRAIQITPDCLIIDPDKDRNDEFSSRLRKLPKAPRIIGYGKTITERDRQKYSATLEKRRDDEEELVKLIEGLK
jgi:hypothetical protein